MELVKSIKQYKILKYSLVLILSTIILAISAKIKIPFYPVPMTMQTFVVILIGICFGWKLGAISIALYLMEGILGLPVFSGTPEKGLGLVYFTGPTMGYLIGFLFAAMLSGFYSYNTNFILNFIKLTLCTSVIYILGIFWLGTIIGWEKPILDLGAKPFLLAELFKITILTILVTLYGNKINLLKKL